MLRVRLRAGEPARDLTDAAVGSSLLHFLRNGDLDAAVFLLAQLSPTHPLWQQGQLQLLHACHVHSDFLCMETAARALRAHDANQPLAQRALALALRYQNRHEEAIQLFADLSVSGDPGLKNIVAVLQRESGARAAAAQLLGENLQADPLHAESFWNYADTFGALPSAARERATRALVDAARTDSDRAYLHFALARDAEATANLGSAAQHYRAGGAAKRRTQRYAHAEELALHAKIQQLCTAERIAAARSALAASAPIFICGLPRSGTSLLEQMLAAHPQVQAGGELVEISVATRQVLLQLQAQTPALQAPYPAWFAQLTSAQATAIGERYLQRTDWLQTRGRFTDKMPAHSKGLGVLAAALPRAKIIWCARHPVATAIGCFRQLFVDAAPWSYNESELAELIHAHTRLMQHWLRALPPGQLCTVYYENLVQAPEASLHRLLGFLDLSWDARCLHFQQQPQNVRTQSSQQVRQGLHAGHLDRWRDWLPHFPELNAALAELSAAYDARQHADLQDLQTR